jgi:predicted ribosome quality control (RQC) complex YloA/Tae2 family protein
MRIPGPAVSRAWLIGYRLGRLSGRLAIPPHMSQTEKSVIPFAPPEKDDNQLDKAGKSILNLLHKAAGVAEQNSQHALDIAQQLSHQLRAAEQRIADLEAEAEGYRDRAGRAERWLHKVYSEIEERFLRQERARTTAP